MLKNYHVFICSLGNIDRSHADNTVNGLICTILYRPVIAVFLRQDLESSRQWMEQLNTKNQC
jgi:hypothetical protein